MRIAGGEWRGRNLVVPSGDAVRPTQDRVREALFSIIQGAVPGAAFLDLFAGSGSVGLEALSRGAATATFVEMAPRHLACLQRNIATMKAEARCTVVRADVYRWLATGAVGFDVVYADPPYELGAEQGYAQVLALLAERGVVKPGGIFIAEMKVHQRPDSDERWELVRDREYGQTRIAVYARKVEA